MQRLQFALPSHRAFMCVVRLHMTQKTGLEPDPHPVTVSGTYCSVLSTGPPLGHRYRFPGGRGRANNCVAEFLIRYPPVPMQPMYKLTISFPFWESRRHFRPGFVGF